MEPLLARTTVFEALADPTRRMLLDRLRDAGDRGASIADLSLGLPMTRQAVTKHLDALHDAGLLRVRREGRQRLHELDATPLEAVDDWLAPYEAFWDQRIAALRRHLGEDEGEPLPPMRRPSPRTERTPRTPRSTPSQRSRNTGGTP